MPDVQNLLQIEFVEVGEKQVNLRLKGNSATITLTLSGQMEDGERYYEGLNSVFFNGVKDSENPKVALLLEKNPIFGMHAVLREATSTLCIGTHAQPIQNNGEGNYTGGHSTMKLEGDKWVPVQG